MSFVNRANKKLLLGVIWSAVAVSWVILGAVFFLSEERTTAVIAVTSAAVIAEVAVWLSALLLGLAMVDARKTIWRKLFQRKLA